jgi:alpha-1,2-mannosyltransferase
VSRPQGRTLLAVTVALAAAGLMVILTQSPASRLSSDFTINYSAGVLVREGHLAAPYDQAALGAMMRRVAPDGAIDPRLPFSLPLAAALPYAALSLLPRDVAFRLFQLLSAALIVVAVMLLQRAAPLEIPLPRMQGRVRMGVPALAVLGLLAAVPTWGAFTEGQPTAWLFLGAAMVVLALRSDSTALAAAAGMLLAVKPQYLPAYLAILFAARRWRSLAAAAVGGGLLVLSPLAGGLAGLTGMVHNALSANQAVAVRLNEAWVGVFGTALPPRATTVLAIALYLAVLAALAWLAWRRPASVIAYAAFAGVLDVLASPHALPHDLLILAVPAWLAIVLYREGSLPSPIPALLAFDVALLIDLRGIAVPLGPLVMTAALLWYGWQFRQRAEQRRRPPLGRVA